jgi:hypothetical protein
MRRARDTMLGSLATQQELDMDTPAMFTELIHYLRASGDVEHKLIANERSTQASQARSVIVHQNKM